MKTSKDKHKQALKDLSVENKKHALATLDLATKEEKAAKTGYVGKTKSSSKMKMGKGK